jgi:hypothetical protein
MRNSTPTVNYEVCTFSMCLEPLMAGGWNIEVVWECETSDRIALTERLRDVLGCLVGSLKSPKSPRPQLRACTATNVYSI